MKINQLKVGVFLSYVIIILNCAVNIIFSPFMVRQLGQAQYGLYQLIGAFVGYLTVLDFGLGNAVIKYVAKYRHLKDEKQQSNFLAIIFILYVLISLFIAILGIVLYFNLQNIFGASLTGEEIEEAKVMFIILIINMMIAIPGGIFASIINGYEKYIIPRVLSIGRILSRVIVLVAVLTVSANAINVVIVDTILNILIILINFIVCKKHLKIKMHLYYFDKPLVREVFGYSFFIFLNMIIDQLNWKVDQTLIGIRLSTVAVTIYSIGNTFSSIFQQFSSSISGVFLPKVTQMELEHKNGKDFTNFMIKVGRIQAIILLYIYVAFILFGNQFIKMLYGDGYKESWISAVLVMTGLLIPLMQNVGLAILQAKNKHKVYTMTFLIATVINAIFTYIILPYTGIVGAAAVTAIGLLIGHTIPLNIYYQLKIHLDMKRFFKELCHGTLVVMIGVIIIMSIMLSLLPVNSWISFLVMAALYTILYFGFMYLIGLQPEEKLQINQFIKKITRSREK